VKIVMSEDEVANWLYDKVAATLAGTYTMGDLEQAVDRMANPRSGLKNERREYCEI